MEWDIQYPMLLIGSMVNLVLLEGSPDVEN